MKTIPVKLTAHAQERISKRFGIKSKESALRFAEDIVRNGIVNPTQKGSYVIMHNGHSYIFTKVQDKFTQKEVMLMITACNDDKSSEWVTFHHGQMRKASTIKQSKIHRGSAVNKCRSKPKYNHHILDDEECA